MLGPLKYWTQYRNRVFGKFLFILYVYLILKSSCWIMLLVSSNLKPAGTFSGVFISIKHWFITWLKCQDVVCKRDTWICFRMGDLPCESLFFWFMRRSLPEKLFYLFFSVIVFSVAKTHEPNEFILQGFNVKNSRQLKRNRILRFLFSFGICKTVLLQAPVPKGTLSTDGRTATIEPPLQTLQVK